MERLRGASSPHPRFQRIACWLRVSPRCRQAFFAFGLEDIVNAAKEKTAELVNKAKAHAQGEAEAPTCRTILIAACMGVFMGFLLRL